MKPLTLIDKAFLLKRTSLFEALDLDLLLSFADKLTVVTFDEGESIFNIGQEAHRMYFIAKGEIQLKDAHGMMLETLETPEYFGDEALFSEQAREYQAKAATDAIILALSRSHINMMISEAPSIAQRFLQDYAIRMPNKYVKEEQ